MIGMDGDKCPFTFNFDPATFKVGDTVSYRVPKLGDFPFAAQIVAVFDDHIDIVNPAEPDKVLQATREARPVVSDEQALS
ncbi:hypothetical protein [Sinimarinibacterium flocculans]|uniref:Uncharacterized protein n=1 Tax=Sinimarinibacterium flocculans TaxID=985250 RepID=A0A318EDR0_9GAMM|nr:hypothetical protein [Sinimarinibacterium flocculans]PXV68319.1 hypothetical protein C8D93_10414 [Sinimarinibacterium flocculans]